MKHRHAPNLAFARKACLRRRLALQGAAAAAWGAAFGASAQLKDDRDPEGSPNWQKVKASLFAGRTIRPDDGSVIRLEAPARAEDASVVPVALRAAFAQTPERHIQRAWLIIDNNPSPVAAALQFTLQAGRADVETRVRIDEYTFVRAIAETQDGQLYMNTRFVKASGGCSAPPTKDQAAALASVGRMRLNVVEGREAAPASPVRAAIAQLMISHPNNSGLAMDQSTRQYAPPYFVRHIDVSYQGRPLLSADVDFSISENPNLRFAFVPQDGGELKVDVVDTHDLTFQTSLQVRPTPP